MAMVMRKRSGSGSKRQLKEKVVQIYESFFRGDDLTADSPTFWDEFFLLKPKILQLESEVSRLSAEQLVGQLHPVSQLFTQCVQAIGQEHHIRVVYALQTASALLAAMYARTSTEPSLDLRVALISPDHQDDMQRLLQHCNTILSAEEVTESVKSLVLKLLLVIVTGQAEPVSNPLMSDLMQVSVFEPLVALLRESDERAVHGRDALTLLTLLLDYNKRDSNPYVVNLSILDDELALNGYAQVITAALGEVCRGVGSGESGGWLSSITGIFGGIFTSDDSPKTQRTTGAEEIMLLALYEASHLNRNFMTTLTHSNTASAPPSPPATLPPQQSPPNAANIQCLDTDQPTNLLVTLLQYCSIVMGGVRGGCEASSNKLRLCFITLTCISEEQLANAHLHDPQLTFKVQLQRLPMRHRKVAVEEPPSQPLAATLIDLLVEFLQCHLMKKFPGELYALCIGIVQRLLAYQKRWRVRLAMDWRHLWASLIYLLKFLANNDAALLKRHNIFDLALQAVNIFNLFITFGDTFLPEPSAYDRLYYELIRERAVFNDLVAMALRYSTGDGTHKADALRLANGLLNLRAIVHHFGPKIDKGLANISTPTEEQILEIVRANYDSLILKLQECVETYARYDANLDEALLSRARSDARARHKPELAVLLAHLAAVTS